MRTTLSLFSSPQQQQQQHQESNECYYRPPNSEQVIKPTKTNTIALANSSSKSAHLLVFPQATSFPFLRIYKQKTEEYQRVSEKVIPSPLLTPQNGTNHLLSPKKIEQTSQLDPQTQNNNININNNNTNNGNFHQEQVTSLEELPDVIPALSESNTDINNDTHRALKLIPTEQWRDNSLSRQAKKLFEIGNGGIVLPRLSYKNAKLRDDNRKQCQQQQLLDNKIMSSMLNLRSLSEENRNYIKKQLLPIKFEGERKTPCESVIDFFSEVTNMNEQKLAKLTQKQQKQQEEEAEERASAYQIQPSPCKSGVTMRFKDIDSPLKSTDSRKRIQELKNYDQINDIRSSEGGEESDLDSQEDQGELVKTHKMNVNFSTRRRAIDPGPVEYLMTSSKETFVQPGFMQERGSMCITELWPESMKLDLVRSHYHNNKRHQQQELRKIMPLLAHQHNKNHNNNNNSNKINKSCFFKSSIKVEQSQQQLLKNSESPRKLPAYVQSDELFHRDVKLAGLPKISTTICQKKQYLSPVDSETQIYNNTNNSRSYVRNRAITEMSESHNEISQELRDEQPQRFGISSNRNIAVHYNIPKNNLASSAALSSLASSSSPSKYYQTTNNTTAVTATQEKQQQYPKISPMKATESVITAATIEKVEQIKSDCEYALSVNQALEESITSDIQAVNNRLDRILLKIK